MKGFGIQWIFQFSRSLIEDLNTKTNYPSLRLTHNPNSLLPFEYDYNPSYWMGGITHGLVKLHHLVYIRIFKLYGISREGLLR